MLVIEGKTLQNAARAAAVATVMTGRRYTRPVLGAIKISAGDGALRISAWDIDNWARETIPAGTNGTGVDALVGAKEFLSVMKEFKAGDPVALIVENNYLMVSSGSRKFRVETITPAEDELPDNPIPVTAEWVVTLDGKEFARALAEVLPAASTDDARPVLESVWVEVKAQENGVGGIIILTAADGFRLHQRVMPAGYVTSNHRVMIGTKAAKAVIDLAKMHGYPEIRMWIDGEYKPSAGDRGDERQKVLFEVGTAFLSSWGVEGTTPDYSQIIPRSKSIKVKAKMDRAGLLERAETVKKNKALAENPLRLRFKPGEPAGSLRLSVGAEDEKTQAMYSDEIGVEKYSGPELLMALQCKFLIDALRAAPGEKVTIQAVSATIPILIDETGPDNPAHEFRAVIMPMHLG